MKFFTLSAVLGLSVVVILSSVNVHGVLNGDSDETEEASERQGSGSPFTPARPLYPRQMQRPSNYAPYPRPRPHGAYYRNQQRPYQAYPLRSQYPHRYRQQLLRGSKYPTRPNIPPLPSTPSQYQAPVPPIPPIPEIPEIPQIPIEPPPHYTPEIPELPIVPSMPDKDYPLNPPEVYQPEVYEFTYSHNPPSYPHPPQANFEHNLEQPHFPLPPPKHEQVYVTLPNPSPLPEQPNYEGQGHVSFPPEEYPVAPVAHVGEHIAPPSPHPYPQEPNVVPQPQYGDIHVPAPVPPQPQPEPNLNVQDPYVPLPPQHQLEPPVLDDAQLFAMFPDLNFTAGEVSVDKEEPYITIPVYDNTPIVKDFNVQEYVVPHAPPTPPPRKTANVPLTNGDQILDNVPDYAEKPKLSDYKPIEEIPHLRGKIRDKVVAASSQVYSYSRPGMKDGGSIRSQDKKLASNSKSDVEHFDDESRQDVYTLNQNRNQSQNQRHGPFQDEDDTSVMTTMDIEDPKPENLAYKIGVYSQSNGGPSSAFAAVGPRQMMVYSSTSKNRKVPYGGIMVQPSYAQTGHQGYNHARKSQQPSTAMGRAGFEFDEMMAGPEGIGRTGQDDNIAVGYIEYAPEEDSEEERMLKQINARKQGISRQ